MLDLQQPADFLTGVRRFTETELLGRRRVPNGRQLDTLADTLASLEYYLEALREHRGNRQDILDIARTSLEALGYWPLPAEAEPERAPPADAMVEDGAGQEPAAAEDTAATVAAFIDRAPDDVESAAVAPADVETGAAAPAPVGVIGGFEAHGDDTEDEDTE